MKRFSRHVLLFLRSYAAYLALLGPFSSLEGRGRLKFLPGSVREACWYPSAPVWLTPGLRRSHGNDLDRWYLDPHAPAPPMDW